MPEPAAGRPSFDAFADRYEGIHNQHLPFGVTSDSFLQQKLQFLETWVQRYLTAFRPLRLLDFGCGTGRLMQRLLDRPWCGTITGVDPSRESLATAGAMLPQAGDRLQLQPSLASLAPSARFHLILALNVLHHIRPDERPATLTQLEQRLTDNGLLVIWEHNPFNPFTRRQIAVCPFDEDAVLVSQGRLRRQVTDASLTCLEQAYINITPPAWHRIRVVESLEKGLGGLPLGTQYYLVTTRARRVQNQSSEREINLP